MADSFVPGEVGRAQAQPEEEVPEALSLPTQPKNLGFQLLYGLANAIIGIGNITFYTLLLPARIGMLAPTNQTNTFILISGIGAFASILTNPLVGALSDRTTSALGRRLPWLILGMVGLLVSMLLLAYASSLLSLGIGSVLLQIAINIILAALSAILPDQIPLSQRATVSAFGGMAPLVGGLIGQIMVGQVIKDITASFLILAQVSIILLLLFSLVLREHRLPQGAVAPFRLQDIPRSLWLNPRHHRDFALTWVARCLVFLASTTVVNYLFYFLETEHLFPEQQVAQGVQIFYAVYVISLLASSMVCGKLSDRLQQRKGFVIGSSLLMTAGLILLAFFPVWNMVLLASVILGIGFGGYLSVDLALASQLLPAVREYGKDIGLMNTAIFLPMLLAPLIAGLALSGFHSYKLLFIILALATTLAAALIRPIKSVQ
jgi:MFS family permease